MKNHITALFCVAALALAAVAADGAHDHADLEARIAALEKEKDQWRAVTDALQIRIERLETAVPPPPPPPVGTLALGLGPAALDAPVDVAEMNAKFPITDDRRSQRLLVGDGSQDLWLGTDVDGVWAPYVVEWSLNGGDWIGGRAVVTQVPKDIPDGIYQLRVTVYPFTGMSQPTERTVERRTFGEGEAAHVFWSYR